MSGAAQRPRSDTLVPLDDLAPIEAFAPGRLCLFGEHQDYLGLAVVALAIDRGVRVRLEPEPGSRALEVELPDVGARDRIAIDGSSAPRDASDWLRAAVQELASQGVALESGARVVARGDLPIGAGCGSSSALVVAFLRALIELGGEEARRLAEPRRLAELAFQAEVARFGAPGGRMDPLASALGGMVHLNFGPTPFVQAIDAPLEGLVLIESGEPKPTAAVLARTRAAVEAALAPLRALQPGFELASISYEEVWNLLIDAAASDREGAARREQLVFATMMNRDLLLAGLRALTEPPDDSGNGGPRRIGELLDQHHGWLRDGLGVSTERIEALRRAALDAGALGAKLTGSGGGGGLFALAAGREGAVIEAAARLGARAQIVRPSAGASVQRRR